MLTFKAGRMVCLYHFSPWNKGDCRGDVNIRSWMGIEEACTVKQQDDAGAMHCCTRDPRRREQLQAG